MEVARICIRNVKFKHPNVQLVSSAHKYWPGLSTKPLLEILERIRDGEGAYDYIAIYEVDDANGSPEVHMAVCVEPSHSLTYMGALHRVMHQLNIDRDKMYGTEHDDKL